MAGNPLKRGESVHSEAGVELALLSGIGFGGFLVLIAQIEGDQVFAPLVFSKLASVILAFTITRVRKLSNPKPSDLPLAIWTGILDAGGNIAYLFATQFARLDIAAVLTSLYPAGTIILSNIILKEKLSSHQWIGAGTCVAAIAFISTG